MRLTVSPPYAVGCAPPGTQYWRRKLADIAAVYPTLAFAVTDESGLGNRLAGFGFDDSGADVNVGILGDGDAKFPMEPMDDYDGDDVRAFIDSYVKGQCGGRGAVCRCVQQTARVDEISGRRNRTSRQNLRTARVIFLLLKTAQHYKASPLSGVPAWYYTIGRSI